MEHGTDSHLSACIDYDRRMDRAERRLELQSLSTRNVLLSMREGLAHKAWACANSLAIDYCPALGKAARLPALPDLERLAQCGFKPPGTFPAVHARDRIHRTNTESRMLILSALQPSVPQLPHQRFLDGPCHWCTSTLCGPSNRSFRQMRAEKYQAMLLLRSSQHVARLLDLIEVQVPSSDSQMRAPSVRAPPTAYRASVSFCG